MFTFKEITRFRQLGKTFSNARLLEVYISKITPSPKKKADFKKSKFQKINSLTCKIK